MLADEFLKFPLKWYDFWWDGQASQSSQNSKFTMSLQRLKKEVRDEVNFLGVDIHQSFLQVKHFTTVKVFS